MEPDCWRSQRFLERAPLVLICLLALVAPDARAQTPGSFATVGDMATGRYFHAAVLLQDGTVLIVGENVAETYDPVTRVFTATGAVSFPRRVPSVLLLHDGRALIAGGHTLDGAPAPGELYDPSTRTFTQVGNRAIESPNTTMTLLKNGKVLILGGVPELFDPSTGMFTIAPGQSTRGSASSIATVTALADGRVLIAATPTSEVYDPETGSFTATGEMKSGCGGGSFIPQYISGRAATLLTNGKVLLTGGHHEDCGRFRGAELFDPGTNTFTPTGSMSRPRDNHAATLLADGTVLITGGESESCDGRGCGFSGTDASAEIYTPATGTFAATGSMAARRAAHTATLLATREVLITGGYFYAGIGAGSCCFASAEVYAPPDRRRRRSAPH